jgi:hypothetical protein
MVVVDQPIGIVMMLGTVFVRGFVRHTELACARAGEQRATLHSKALQGQAYKQQ